MINNYGFNPLQEEDLQGNVNLNNEENNNNNNFNIEGINNQNNEKNTIHFNENSNYTEEISNIATNYVNKYLGFIGKYFNVELEDVKNKLKGALIPMNKSFYESVKQKEDLYVPFWTLATIIFLITLSGNLSGYFKSSDKMNFQYNYDFVPKAAFFFYGFGFGVPILLWILSNYVFKIRDFNLMTNICIYGYSFVILIPILILCIIPSNLLETVLLIYFLFHSCSFLFYNVYVLISEQAPNAKWPFLGILGGIQLFLFLLLKFYFFKAAKVTNTK